MKGFLSGAVFALVLVAALYLAPDGAVSLLLERWLAAREYPVYDPTTHNVAVFITGTSSGIGRHAALTLASQGYHVFATVRRESDAASLKNEHGHLATLHPVLCDVTQPDQIVQARDTIAAWLQQDGSSDVDSDPPNPPRVLAAVINNAGINSDFQLLEHVSIDDTVQRVWEVNVLAPLRLYQAFAPLLKQHSARWIAVGSLAGQVARTFRGPYTMSKFALEGLADTMRQELYFDPVAVILINPGYIQTDIGKKSLEAHHQQSKKNTMGGDATSSAVSLTYQQQTMLEGFETSYSRAFATADGPADSTTPTILRALTDPRPRTRYYPGGAGGMPAWFIPKLKQVMPDRVLDAFMIRVIQKIRTVE